MDSIAYILYRSVGQAHVAGQGEAGVARIAERVGVVHAVGVEDARVDALVVLQEVALNAGQAEPCGSVVSSASDGHHFALFVLQEVPVQAAHALSTRRPFGAVGHQLHCCRNASPQLLDRPVVAGGALASGHVAGLAVGVKRQASGLVLV